MWLIGILIGRPRGDRDGSSPETAVVVNSVGEEYEWIGRHLPGFQSVLQFVQEIDVRPYDVHRLQSDREEEREVYFDISGFYGHS